MRTALALTVIAFLGTGCSAFDFTIDQDTQEVVVQGDLNAFRAKLLLPKDIIPAMQIAYNLDREPNAIYAESLTLNLTDTVPSAKKMTIPFSFVNQLVFYVQSTVKGSTLPKAPLAWIGPTGPGHSIPMTVDSSLDLLPYIREGFEVTSVLNGRVPAADLSFSGHIVLGVDVF